jgi:ubiquinone/menaquinone biosynthesis C-methylase UbiE
MATEQQTADGISGCCFSDSLFERYSWFYALCREHLFYDHSHDIRNALWDGEDPSPGTHLVELGCGPGFYACRFAERYPQLRSTGVDLSRKLLERARHRAARKQLLNCAFHNADVHSLPAAMEPVHDIVVSRLFLIVPNRENVLREIYRVLQPGGRCFIAEPVSAVRTQLPLSAMWLLAKLTSFGRVPYIEPHKVKTMSATEFDALLHAEPWESVQITHRGRYQFGVCTKPMVDAEQAVA